MYVTVLARFHGGDREMLLGLARQAKPIVERSGAEIFSVVQIHTGPTAGDVMVAVRFPNWEVFGKAMQSVYTDPMFLEISGKMAPYFAERTLVTGLI